MAQILKRDHELAEQYNEATMLNKYISERDHALAEQYDEVSRLNGYISRQDEKVRRLSEGREVWRKKWVQAVKVAEKAEDELGALKNKNKKLQAELRDARAMMWFAAVSCGGHLRLDREAMKEEPGTLVRSDGFSAVTFVAK